MDLVLLILALGGDPHRIDGRAAWFATPGAPLAIPVEAIPAPRRVTRLLAEERLPLGVRVALAMAWNGEAGALRLAASWAGPIAADQDLDQALHRWSATACARLGLPADAPLTAIDAAGRVCQPSPEERGALGDMQELLSPLAWPRWRGPLLLVPYGVAHPAIAPGQARVVRPALPVLRPPGGGRGAMAAAMADLAMALSAPPADGWPGWLGSGVAGCASARGEGTGIAERAMAERRATAGAPAIAALLRGDQPVDPALATAVVAALLHPNRRRHFSALLELLRHGAGGTGAIATAYRLTVADLAARPGDAPPPR